ncbi:Uncharacterised protein [Chryseobacterium nakagawai]|nr:hypothetical protein [Chryseobacterium nakagawai]VEH18526.1 Uncharacterised protein [Chryseobacterium nakagawai]
MENIMITGIAEFIESYIVEEFIKNHSENITINPEMSAYTEYL